MLNDVLSFLTRGVSAVFGWFNQLTSAVPGVIPFFLAFFTMYIIFRTLIVPLVGRRVGFSSHENQGYRLDSNGDRVDRYGNYV